MGCGPSTPQEQSNRRASVGERPDYSDRGIANRVRTNTGFNRALLKVILLGDSKYEILICILQLN